MKSSTLLPNSEFEISKVKLLHKWTHEEIEKLNEIISANYGDYMRSSCIAGDILEISTNEHECCFIHTSSNVSSFHELTLILKPKEYEQSETFNSYEERLNLHYNALYSAWTKLINN